MEEFGAIAAKRGCGTRKKGGVYFETGMSPDGMPIEHFLICPPVELPDAYKDISRQGVTAFTDGNGITHLFDWVGEKYYPNVLDFVEEVKRFGLSRRIPKNFDFSLLSPESRILLIHPRAIIENFSKMPTPPVDTDFLDCPKDVNHFEDPDHETFCICRWKFDVRDGEPVMPAEQAEVMISIPVVRHMPSFKYGGFEPWEGADEPIYIPGIFGSFPASRLVVVKDDDDAHLPTLEKVKAAKLPVSEVEN